MDIVIDNGESDFINCERINEDLKGIISFV